MYFRKITAITMLAFFSLTVAAADDIARIVMTPYNEPNIVYDFYFDEPAKINSALYWIRSLMNPLMDEPYNMAPEFMNIKVVITRIGNRITQL